VTLAVLGLLPLGDFAHALSTDGHDESVASAPCEDDCDAGCSERGCTPFDHHCRCCSAMPAMLSLRFPVPTDPARPSFARPDDDSRLARLALPPPTPPPTV
jgi:hypothetical protein